MTKRFLASAVLAVAAAGCGGHTRTAATAPRGTFTGQVDTYLARETANARTQGYTTHVAGPVHASLNNAATTTHNMTVVAGVHYVLYGACDNDCTDLDLKIYDPNGTLLMQDVAVDDQPTLAFVATTSGSLRVEVIMARCNHNPCFYGLQLMAK